MKNSCGIIIFCFYEATATTNVFIRSLQSKLVEVSFDFEKIEDIFQIHETRENPN